MLESHNLLDVQAVFARPSILRDPVDQHRHLWHGRIHPVEQSQFEWHRDLRETFRPVGLDLTVFDLLRARDDLGEPLTLYRGCDPFVPDSHRAARGYQRMTPII
jgi:hypothetical protein